MMYKKIYLVLLLLLTQLSACGFHLRGTQALPAEMAVTFIQSNNPSSELLRQLKRSLRAANINVVEQLLPEAAILDLQEQSGRRTLSVDADGRALEYEVFYTALFSVRQSNSTFTIPQQNITLTRDYIFDRLEVLAANAEEAALILDMQRELVRMIMDRIAILSQTQSSTINTGTHYAIYI